MLLVLTLYCAILIAFTMIVLVTVLAMGGGEPAEVQGRVRAFGMDYATSSGVPRAVVSVELDSGEAVNVLGKRGILIGIGDRVVLMRSGGRSSPDVDYRFLRVAEE